MSRAFAQKYKLVDFSLIWLFGILVYSCTLYSSFHLDDFHSIVNNPAIRNISDLGAIWSFWPCRFITYLSLALNYHFSHLNVLGYHFFNLGIHIICGILVYWLTTLIFNTPAMRGDRIAQAARMIALFTALIFVTHPLQTQAVTYIIQRAASLAALFYLLTVCFYIKFRLVQEENTGPAAARWLYCGSLFSMILAMFTKENTISLPLMILCCEISFFKKEKNLNWRKVIPFILALFIIPLTMFLTKSVDFVNMKMTLGHAPGISPQQYLFTEFRVIITYLRLIILPLNQNLDYDYPIAASLFSAPVIFSLAGIILILAGAAKMFSRYRLISCGIFWFFLAILPESSVIPIQDVIFEHRLYLGLAGFSLALVSCVYYLFEKQSQKMMTAVLVVLVFVYAILGCKRNLIWQDELTLWNDVARKSPHKARVYNNRGNAYDGKGLVKQAIIDYTQAIALKPDFAEAYNNRGDSYCKLGDLNQAVSDFNKAIALKPDFAEAYNNRGVVYKNQGNLLLALADYSKAIEINPYLIEAYNNRGYAYYKQGNLSRALSDYNKAIEINPDRAEPFQNRAAVFYAYGEYGKAWKDVYQVERLGYAVNPDFKSNLVRTFGRDK